MQKQTIVILLIIAVAAFFIFKGDINAPTLAVGASPSYVDSNQTCASVSDCPGGAEGGAVCDKTCKYQLPAGVMGGAK